VEGRWPECFETDCLMLQVLVWVVDIVVGLKTSRDSFCSLGLGLLVVFLVIKLLLVNEDEYL